MTNERYMENYNGQKIMVYGLGNKWQWQVLIINNSLKSQVKTSKVPSPKSYLTKEKAITSARKHLNNITMQWVKIIDSCLTKWH